VPDDDLEAEGCVKDKHLLDGPDKRKESAQ
jgi:hypothetical protein